mgnify:CR=1 FL=1
MLSDTEALRQQRRPRWSEAGHAPWEHHSIDSLLHSEADIVARLVQFSVSRGHLVLQDEGCCSSAPCLDALRALGRFVIACYLLNIFDTGRLEVTRFEGIAEIAEIPEIAPYRWSRVLYADLDAMCTERVYVGFVTAFVYELLWAFVSTAVLLHNAHRFSLLTSARWLQLFISAYADHIKLDLGADSKDFDKCVESINSLALQTQRTAHHRLPRTGSTVSALVNELVLVLEGVQGAARANGSARKPSRDVEALSATSRHGYDQLKAFHDRIQWKGRNAYLILSVAIGWACFVIVCMLYMMPFFVFKQEHTLFETQQSLTLTYLFFSACLVLAIEQVGARVLVAVLLNTTVLLETRRVPQPQHDGPQALSTCSSCCRRFARVMYYVVTFRWLHDGRCAGNWLLWYIEPALWSIILVLCVYGERGADLYSVLASQLTDFSNLTNDLPLRVACWNSPQPALFTVSLVVWVLVIGMRLVDYTMKHNLLQVGHVHWHVHMEFALTLLLQFSVVTSGLYIARNFLSVGVRDNCDLMKTACDSAKSTPALAFWLDRAAAQLSSHYIGSLSSAAFLSLQSTDPAAARDYETVLNLCYQGGSATTTIGEDTDTTYSLYLIVALYLFFVGIIGFVFGVLTVVRACYRNSSYAENHPDSSFVQGLDAIDYTSVPSNAQSIETVPLTSNVAGNIEPTEGPNRAGGAAQSPIRPSATTDHIATIDVAEPLDVVAEEAIDPEADTAGPGETSTVEENQ